MRLLYLLKLIFIDILYSFLAKFKVKSFNVTIKEILMVEKGNSNLTTFRMGQTVLMVIPKLANFSMDQLMLWVNGIPLMIVALVHIDGIMTISTSTGNTCIDNGVINKKIDWVETLPTIQH